MNGLELEAFRRDIALDSDRSLLGIPPGIDNGPFTYEPAGTGSQTGFTPTSHQLQHAASNPFEDPENDALYVDGSLQARPASRQESTFSRSSLTNFTFNELWNSRQHFAFQASLAVQIPERALFRSGTPASPRFLDTQSRSSGHEHLTTISPLSPGYTSSEGIGRGMLEDMSIESQSNPGPSHIIGQQEYELRGIQSFSGTSVLEVRASTQRQPQLIAPSNVPDVSSLEDHTWQSASSSHEDSAGDLERQTSSAPKTGSKRKYSLTSQINKKKRKCLTPEKRGKTRSMREIKACIRCHVLHITVRS